MVGRHHQLNELELEQTLGDSEDREAWCAAMGSQRFGHDLATEQQQHRNKLDLVRAKNLLILDYSVFQ